MNRSVLMDTKPRLLTILDIITGVLFAIAVGMVFFYAPLEATMGEVQRVFYFHVSSAWVGSLGFAVALVAGILYLVKGDRKWDVVEVAAVEISLVFFFITIASGYIWSALAWHMTVWQAMEPRLATAAIVELVYAAYMLLRQGIEDPDRRARFGAIYVILGFVTVPLTFLSIRLLRSIHPVLFGPGSPNAQGDMAMTSEMYTTFFFSLFVFSVLFVDLLWHRIRLGRLASQVEQLRLKVTH